MSLKESLNIFRKREQIILLMTSITNINIIFLWNKTSEITYLGREYRIGNTVYLLRQYSLKPNFSVHSELRLRCCRFGIFTALVVIVVPLLGCVVLLLPQFPIAKLCLYRTQSKPENKSRTITGHLTFYKWNAGARCSDVYGIS